MTIPFSFLFLLLLLILRTMPVAAISLSDPSTLTPIENCTCTATFTETGTGIGYTFDLRGLSTKDGYTLLRPDLQWNITFSLCDSSLSCADGYSTQYLSRTPVVQTFFDPRIPGPACPNFDPPYTPIPCTPLCVPLAIPDSLIIVPQNYANLATGGLQLTWKSAYDSPTDPYTCPGDPNRNGIPLLREVFVYLSCDTNGTSDTLNFIGTVDEPSACKYIINGATKAACGTIPPSPSPTPSVTASPSATGTSTGTGTGSPTPTTSSTVTVSSTPLLIDGIYSPLDRDVGIGFAGSAVGIFMMFLCLLIAYRNLCPWQWNWRRLSSSSSSSSSAMNAYSYRTNYTNNHLDDPLGNVTSTFPDYGYGTSTSSNNAAFNIRRDKPNRTEYGTIGSGFQ